MEHKDFTTYYPSVAAILLVLFFLSSRFLDVERFPNEPPYITSSIPYFGHAIGLFLNKIPYYNKVNAKYNYPAFTLAMPAGKVYVVSSPDVAREVQRHSKTLSFPWIEAIFGVSVAGLSKEGAALVFNNVQGEGGEHGIFFDGLKLMINILKPGVALDEMNKTMLESVSDTMSEFDEGPISEDIDLWAWIKHMMILAATDAIYGPGNPFKDPQLEKDMWHISDNVSSLLIGILPMVFARKSHLVHRRVTQAFENFYRHGKEETSSTMTQGRYNDTKGTMSLNDIARLDVAQGITVFSNTVPSGFWTLYHVLSKPDVLSLVRSEAMKHLHTEEFNGKIQRMLDVKGIRSSTILESVLKESLRHQALEMGTRMVVEDVVIGGANPFLLKKDCFVMLPNQPMHFNEKAWGPNVREFDPLRFTKSGGSHQGVAFRGFGGGANLCGGRFFASTEILFIVSMCALRYDMKPVGGIWNNPSPDHNVMSSVVTPPLKKTIVRMKSRKGIEDGNWGFRL
ncbi:hypothetical protein HYALB_00012077 [Hymenoscyphus albidus]|uniref:Cytochrome P450 n=1 Tax=Hymenoscyphus albidus TaxID=595503 RepID=A0A9N9LVX0_9HELO|nr:hypothetical protein HYALB_00012077 [Hymenoscyphus albidus]